MLSEPGGRLAVDDDLLPIARRAFEKAWKRRLDYLATTESAVREIQIVHGRNDFRGPERTERRAPQL